jgi:hypothetical protein
VAFLPSTVATDLRGISETQAAMLLALGYNPRSRYVFAHIIGHTRIRFFAGLSTPKLDPAL